MSLLLVLQVLVDPAQRKINAACLIAFDNLRALLVRIFDCPQMVRHVLKLFWDKQADLVVPKSLLFKLVEVASHPDWSGANVKGNARFFRFIQ
ncbi:hypothetical protein [Brevibacillus agri]|uniref:hypothetical protein n=1 Tax=Brevibacillus agri TaxID=51101 RepID=UPI003D1F8B82